MEGEVEGRERVSAIRTLTRSLKAVLPRLSQSASVGIRGDDLQSPKGEEGIDLVDDGFATPFAGEA